AADVNGDGWTDLVSGGSNVAIALGSSSGAFAPPTTLSSSGAVAIGDMNGDDHPDIVVAQSNGIALHGGSAGGTFSSPAVFTSSLSLSGGIAITDLDNDGKLDVVATTSSPNNTNLAVYLNVGFGFAPSFFSSASPNADGI